MFTWSSKKMESAEDLNPKAYQILTLLLDTELSQDTCTAVSQYYYLKQKCFFFITFYLQRFCCASEERNQGALKIMANEKFQQFKTSSRHPHCCKLSLIVLL